MKKQLLGLAVLAAAALGLSAQTISTFEDPKLPAQGFLNGKRVTTVGHVVSGGVTFSNSYSTAFGYWSGGFAVTNQRNDSTPGFASTYSAITAFGVNSNNYAIGQGDAKVKIPANRDVHGMFVTNSTYAYHSMKTGDQFAKKFGGDTGNDPDYFELKVNGYQNGVLKSTPVTFMLADFRFADNTKDYIVDQWTWVDLAALKDADSLVFELSSSDTGQFGMNTPNYFGMDDFSVADTSFSRTVTTASFEEVQLALDAYWNGEPKAPITGYQSGNAFFNNRYTSYWASGFELSNVIDSIHEGYTNQNAAITGSGYQSAQYAVATGGARVKLTGTATGKGVEGFYITNSTYAYLSMKNGDTFAKKFGGTNGSDPDYFEVVIRGHRNGAIADSVVVALADFRSANNSEDFILRTWKWVNLQSLGDVDSLSFGFRSSDVGQFGMNTPAYFCMDNFTTKDAPAPSITTGNVSAFICAGKSINLSFDVSEAFSTGNTFTAQLSDASGSFATPVIVGSVSATDSGSIAVTIPGNTAAGAGYKLRVVATVPAATGQAGNSFAIGLKPSISFITGDSFPFQNETKTYSVPAHTGATYVWSFIYGLGTSTTNSIDINWKETGTIKLKVVETSAEGCASDTAMKSITINNPVGLNDIGNTLDASIYPNPASTSVYVTLPAGTANAAISLFDVTGKEVWSQQGTEPVNVAAMNKGLYVIRISAGGKSVTKRLIIN